MSEKPRVVPIRGHSRIAKTCNQCGERKKLVLAGSVCRSCSGRLDQRWASATEADWVLVTTPGLNDKVHSRMQALKESLDSAGGRLHGDEDRAAAVAAPVRYIYRNTTFAEMRSHWATADPPDSGRLGLATPEEIGQMKSEWVTRPDWPPAPLVRPARPEEIAEHTANLQWRQCYEETTAILEKWGFNDEYTPVDGVWDNPSEQRAKQAYEEIRARLERLGWLEGSGYEKPHDQMVANYYTAQEAKHEGAPPRGRRS